MITYVWQRFTCAMRCPNSACSTCAWYSAYCTVKVQRNLDAAIVLATTRKLLLRQETWRGYMWHACDICTCVIMCLQLCSRFFKVFSVWRYSYIFQVMTECVCRKCMRPHSLILVYFSWSSDYQWSSKGGFKHGTATRHYVQRIFYSLVLHMPENKSKRSTTWYK